MTTAAPAAEPAGSANDSGKSKGGGFFGGGGGGGQAAPPPPPPPRPWEQATVAPTRPPPTDKGTPADGVELERMHGWVCCDE